MSSVFEKALQHKAAAFCMAVAGELDQAADALVMDTREDMYTAEELLNRIGQRLNELKTGTLTRAESELSELKMSFLP